jgi:hypothetical protein
MSQYLRVTNWNRYQHYKQRNPAWVKFYVDLLDPHNKLNDLPVTTRFLFDRMLLLAASWDNAVPNCPETLGTLLRMESEDCREGVALLLKGRWLSETKTNRRASKGARKGSSKSATTEVEVYREEIDIPSVVSVGVEEQHGDSEIRQTILRGVAA